jgi:hypothetical protein
MPTEDSGVLDAPQVEAETPTEATEAESVDTTAETAAVETEAEKPKPQPGTPDKALQKLQQDFAALKRQLDKKAEPTTADVKMAKSRLGELQHKLAEKKFDSLDDAELLANAIVELGQQQQTLHERAEEATAAQKQAAAASSWAVFEAKYPDAKVKTLWPKCLEDAIATLGDDVPDKAISRLASKYLEERAGAVQQSRKADTPDEPKKKIAPTAGRVQIDAGRAPANEKTELDVELELARNLNKLRGQ